MNNPKSSPGGAEKGCLVNHGGSVDILLQLWRQALLALEANPESTAASGAEEERDLQ